MTPIMEPTDPTRLTPRTTHGFADMIRKAAPERKRERAPRAVKTRPPPVYLNVSWRYDRSAGLSESRVSRLKKPFTTTIVPAIAP